MFIYLINNTGINYESIDFGYYTKLNYINIYINK